MVQITGFKPTQESIDTAKPNFEPFSGKHMATLVLVKEEDGNDNWEFNIISGPYQGRKIWLDLNFNGAESWMTAKAEAYLSEMCFATNFTPKEFTNEFEGHTVVLDLFVNKKGYQAVRQIMAQSTPIDTAKSARAAAPAPAAAQPAQPAAQPAQQAASPSNAPPWKR